MKFFNDLGKMVANASQKTVQKTKEISEIARINSMISQNENLLDDVYRRIGKLYVSLHTDDCEKIFAELVMKAAELKQKDVEYHSQIQRIKGFRRCVNCGADVPRDFAFCNFCGTAMPPTEVKRDSEDPDDDPEMFDYEDDDDDDDDYDD